LDAVDDDELPMKVAILISIADSLYGFEDEHESVLEDVFIKTILDKMQSEEHARGLWTNTMEMCIEFLKQVISCLKLETGKYDDDIGDTEKGMGPMQKLRQNPGKYNNRTLLAKVPPAIKFGVMLWCTDSVMHSRKELPEYFKRIEESGLVRALYDFYRDKFTDEFFPEGRYFHDQKEKIMQKVFKHCENPK
jgi:NurA-like 5'-3' nuclease